MEENQDSTKTVAIACQGGGSHTAFSAGALKELLQEDGYRISGFSGTSGGAICSLLAWYGLIEKNRSKSIELLDEFWSEMEADTPWEYTMNNWIVGAKKMHSEIGNFEISPYYNPFSSWGQEKIKDVLKEFIDFGSINELVGKDTPDLFIGAVNLKTGGFKVFKNEEITPDAVLASAALPSLFKAVEVDGEKYWDGMLSENPPISRLTDSSPDEIWIIQTNQQEEKDVPKSMSEIYERRNDLAGNLSLNQEIRFIEKINQLIDEGVIEDRRYKKIEIRKIIFERDLEYGSKLDRRPELIQEMMRAGEEKADEMLRELE